MQNEIKLIANGQEQSNKFFYLSKNMMASKLVNILFQNVLLYTESIALVIKKLA